ncbi:MAG: TauD/TfdA family dioxygenase [Burkholderiaceae bacterium]
MNSTHVTEALAVQAGTQVTPSSLPPAVTSPAAWVGADIAKGEQWVAVLADAEIAEVEQAINSVLSSGTDLRTLNPERFPLPQLAKRLENLRHDLLHGLGFAVLRGLPVQRWNAEQSAAACLGLGAHIGLVRSQNGKGHLLGHVQDLGRDAVNDPTARIYQTTERQTFHTDSCDVVSLLCLKTAKRGGESALVSSMTVYNEMLARRPDLLAELFQPMHTDRRGEIPAGEKPWHEIPVFSWYEGALSALYARRYIDSARRFDEVPAFTPAQKEALDMFDSLAEDLDLGLRLSFEPGDMQWVHNHTMLHDRTAFEDWEDPADKRHLLRLWLAVPGARPLPAVYAQRFGSTTIGDRGGIELPGVEHQIPFAAV